MYLLMTKSSSSCEDVMRILTSKHNGYLKVKIDMLNGSERLYCALVVYVALVYRCFSFFSFYTFQVEQKVELLSEVPVVGSSTEDLLVVSHDIPSREIIDGGF